MTRIDEPVGIAVGIAIEERRRGGEFTIYPSVKIDNCINKCNKKERLRLLNLVNLIICSLLCIDYLSVSQ